MNISKNPVTVAIPGKLFFAGEYAVTRPGGMALVTTIETDFSVTISQSTSGRSKLSTNIDLPDFEFMWERFTDTDASGWEFVLKTLKLMKISGYPEIDLRIESLLGFGETKKGYGSSSCVVVGVVKAVNAFYGLNLSLDEQFKIAGEAHYRVQGSGSLGDVAAITYGGMIFYRSGNREIVVKHSGIYMDFSGYEIKPLALPETWQTYVVETGKAAKTGEKLKIELSEDFYKRSDELVIEQATAIDMQDFALFKEKLLENQLLLLENIPEGYMTQKLALALNIVNSYPELAGKISGAGFGENIVVFAESDENIPLISEELKKNGMTMAKFQPFSEK